MDKFPEKVDKWVVEEVARMQATVDEMMPTSSMLQSMLLSSFASLTNEQRASIISKLGVEWYLTLARKLEKDVNNGR